MDATGHAAYLPGMRVLGNYGPVWILVAVAIVAGLVARCASAQGAYLTTEAFLDACTRTDQAWISFCDGYIQATYDAAVASGLDVCVPSTVTRNDLAFAAIEKLEDAEDTTPASIFLQRMLAADYPC